MSQPRQLDNPLYILIRNEQISAFNAQRPKDTVVDLSNGDFRGIDLRALDAQGINFTNAYFRGTDLRGLDLRNAQNACGHWILPVAMAKQVAHCASISSRYWPAMPALSNCTPARINQDCNCSSPRRKRNPYPAKAWI